MTNRSGRNSGQAFVQFSTPEDATRALQRDRELMGHRWASFTGTCDLLFIPPRCYWTRLCAWLTGRLLCLQIHWGVSQWKWRTSIQEDEEFRFFSEQRSAGRKHHIQWGASREPLWVLADACWKQFDRNVEKLLQSNCFKSCFSFDINCKGESVPSPHDFSASSGW